MHSFLFAQEENTKDRAHIEDVSRDSVFIQDALTDDIIAAPKEESVIATPVSSYQMLQGSPYTPTPPTITAPMPSFDKPYLAAWRNGILIGSHGSESARGLYDANYASITAYQNLGRFSFTGTASLNKIATFHNITNGGAINITGSFYVNKNITLTAFGGTNINGLFESGSRPSYYYGGFASILTNNHKWGVDVGVRRVYNPYMGNWETIPIAMPYYNLNGAKLGVDFGGLIYNAIQSARDAKVSTGDPRMGNPTILPKQQKVEVRPLVPQKPRETL